MKLPLYAEITKRLAIASDGIVEVDETALYRSLSLCDPAFGDVTSNIAMQQAKKLQLNPVELANKLVQAVVADDCIASAEVAGPGFINIKLQDGFLMGLLTDMQQVGYQQWLQQTMDVPTTKMVIDYSHPNMGKPMGVHHLLSTIIGDSIKRMYRFAGVEVVADNFIGDLGTQFGKLIHAVKQWGDLKAIEQDPVAELLKLYVQFHIEADKDVELDDAGRAEYLKLESGDPENRELWQKIVGWSLKDVGQIYSQLDIQFDAMNGESFYEDKMAPIIEQGKQQGYFVESDGALVAFMKDPNQPPAIVQKGDGATLYLTRDLARIAYWEQKWQPDLMVVVVDSAQRLHFQQVFEVAEHLKLTEARNIHVEFGRMRFADKSMSTRKGNILLLNDLLVEARKRAAVTIEEASSTLDEPKQAKLAELLAVGAVKYNILHQHRQSDISFDWSTMLALEGDAIPYIMYSYVRARAISQKATELPTQPDHTVALSQHERELLIDTVASATQVERALKQFEPHVICELVYKLCQKYNKFYNTSPILSDTQHSVYRLQINSAVQTVLLESMHMLGIELPDRM